MPPATPTSAELRALLLPLDPAAYSLEDAAGTVAGAAIRWRWTVEGLDDLPGAALVALEAVADALAAAGGAGGDLATLAAGVEGQLRRLSADHGPRTPLVAVVGPSHPLVSAVEAVDRMLSAAGRAVAAEVVGQRSGRLTRINVSSGGVPKSRVRSVEVGPFGLVGDRQAARRHHGRPFQSVSLFSDEVIEAFAGEGHPIGPGAVGENLTVSGLDWGGLRPGVRLAVGDPDGPDGPDGPVVLELSAWAAPCRKVAGAFADRRSEHLDHDLHPGRARAYAHVVLPGRLVEGSVVSVLP